MKQKDVKIGGLYACKVSGRMAKVKVLSEYQTAAYGNVRSRTKFCCINTDTGRQVNCSAARLRHEILTSGPDGSPMRPAGTQLTPTSMPLG